MAKWPNGWKDTEQKKILEDNTSINVHIPIEVFCDSHSGTARGIRLFGPATVPFRVKPISSQILSTQTTNVRWKSLTVICKQFKRAANVFLRIHTTRQENQIEKEEQTTTTTDSWRTPWDVQEEYRRTLDIVLRRKWKQHHMEIITLKKQTNHQNKKK